MLHHASTIACLRCRKGERAAVNLPMVLHHLIVLLGILIYILSSICAPYGAVAFACMEFTNWFFVPYTMMCARSRAHGKRASRSLSLTSRRCPGARHPSAARSRAVDRRLRGRRASASLPCVTPRAGRSWMRRRARHTRWLASVSCFLSSRAESSFVRGKCVANAQALAATHAATSSSRHVSSPLPPPSAPCLVASAIRYICDIRYLPRGLRHPRSE